MGPANATTAVHANRGRPRYENDLTDDEWGQIGRALRPHPTAIATPPMLSSPA